MEKCEDEKILISFFFLFLFLVGIVETFNFGWYSRNIFQVACTSRFLRSVWLEG